MSSLHSVVLAMTMLLVSAWTGEALGQNNRYTDRSFVPAPSVQAMGDAGVAFPGSDRPFFYNPAQLPHLPASFTVVSVQAAASPDLDDQIDFLNGRVEPAVESGFDLEGDELEALYREAYTLGRSPTRGTGAVVLPSFIYSTQGVGVGGGLFAKTALNYRIEGGGLGVPDVFLLSRTDVMALGAIGIGLGFLGLPGLSVGVTGTRTRRFLAFKNKPLDTFRPDEEAVLLRGNTLQLDVGGLYVPTWWRLPGIVSVGGAVYDVLDQQYDYTFGGAPSRLPFLNDFTARSGAVDAAIAAREAERARRQFELNPSYRVGVAYQLPALYFLEDVGAALDYQGTGGGHQHSLARIHLGVRARPADPVVVRGGLSAGYPTGGVGLQLGPVSLDYALHAFEEGRRPGQLGTYVHSARLTLRL